jgi:hypothetical protein
MGKGKNKKKSKKQKDHQLPTHLAGVPLPQNLREVAATAQQLVRHPVVSDIISAGVLAAIAALAENESVRRAARNVGDEAEDAVDEAARTASRAKVAVKAAAGAMGKRLIDEVKSTSGVKKSSKSAGKEPAHAG